jgi:hypothetical protein
VTKETRKPDRDPLSWKPDRHPPRASKQEVSILTGDSLSVINARCREGRYVTFYSGRKADIDVASVFADEAHIREASADTPRPKAGPGRPRKDKSPDHQDGAEGEAK